MTLLRSMRPPAIALVISLGLACVDPVAPLDTEVAYFDVIERQDGSFFTTTPEAFFFRARDVEPPTSIVTTEGCRGQAYQAPPSSSLATISAGPSVSVAVSGIEALLTPGISGGIDAYVLPIQTSLEFVPGDSITFEVPSTSPGATPRTVKGRTAEAFIPATISQPGVGEPVPVQWAEWDDETPLLVGSAMLYSFRFASSGGTALNREVACVFFDDGSATVPYALLEEFFPSTNREIEATRLRVGSFRNGSVISVVAARLSLPVAVTSTQ